MTVLKAPSLKSISFAIDTNAYISSRLAENLISRKRIKSVEVFKGSTVVMLGNPLPHFGKPAPWLL